VTRVTDELYIAVASDWPGRRCARL